jgi:pimeloyl-ACP methyl ester carboxylesterase
MTEHPQTRPAEDDQPQERVDGSGQTAVEATLMRGVSKVAGVTDHVVHHWAPNGARAVVNAFFGDRLHESGSPLSHTMGVREHGRSVPLTADGLATAFPQPSGEIAVLVHGLIVTETVWDAGKFGQQLEDDFGFTVVKVRYNTGLRISHNGHELDRVLASLVAHWPVPVTRIVLIGHSMGGLVIHSALALADIDPTLEVSPWVALVTDTATLGSPHLGAPLERAVNHALRVGGGLRPLRPVTALLRSRSVGIQDLRHGNILDGEWDGLDPDDHKGRRVDVPLHPGIRHFAVVGLLGKKIDSRVARIFGDGMVTAASAGGSGRRSPESRRFAREDVVVLPGVSHLALVHDPSVYAALRDRLGARVDP